MQDAPVVYYMKVFRLKHQPSSTLCIPASGNRSLNIPHSSSSSTEPPDQASQTGYEVH